MIQQDIIQLTTKELRERLKDERTHLTKSKMTHAVSPVENPLKLRTDRRTVARILTELRKRELEEKTK